jgi:antitoxin component YwqK of YwqJK toxin-antitoxin module
MKQKIRLIILLAASSIFVHGQTVKKIYFNWQWKAPVTQDSAKYYRIVKFDKKNNPDGKISDYFITGELQAEIDGALKIDSLNDSNSVFIKKTTRYTKSGKKESETIRDEVGNRISSTAWYESGSVRYEIQFKDGKENGVSGYFYENGNKKADFPYINGKKEGVAKWYYIGGDLLSEIPYTNNKKNGTGKWYYQKQGSLHSEVNYVDDMKNGVAKYYYETGELDDETIYKDDTIIGISKYYYKDGKLQAELPHNNGKLDGTYKSYYENGKSMSTYDYLGDSLNGYVILYWENGKLKRRDKYENGKFVEGKCYDSTGVAVEHFDYYVEGPSEDVFTIVQQMPVFPGNVNEYLSKNVTYPKKEQKMALQAQFI